MDGMYNTHKDVPYGWVLWIGPVLRAIRRLFGASAGLAGVEASVVETLGVGLNNPAGPH
ncbi:hypothetical protein [Phenylobacterium sp.]|uniref:hypothetical protein n=1 Tax=Phenylobacterium sp. TaxID=1871053 RepID=UPI003565F83D